MFAHNPFTMNGTNITFDLEYNIKDKVSIRNNKLGRVDYNAEVIAYDIWINKDGVQLKYIIDNPYYGSYSSYQLTKDPEVVKQWEEEFYKRMVEEDVKYKENLLEVDDSVKYKENLYVIRYFLSDEESMAVIEGLDNEVEDDILCIDKKHLKLSPRSK